VVRVVDGDTIRVVIVEDSPGPPSLREGGEYRVRLADINAPEIDTQEGVEAKRALESITPPGSLVILDVDDIHVYDRYGRLVAVVIVESGGAYINVNAWLVAEGYAEIWDHENEFDPSLWTVTATLEPSTPGGAGEPQVTPILAAALASALIIVLAAAAKRLLGL
jgi:endonuclease YncB( thermonuclease family)